MDRPEACPKKWTGGARVMTVAVVFTDIVDSAKLCVDLGDAAWDGIRQQHFAQAVRLVHQRQGTVIKNTGDGILALFHDATAAVSFSNAGRSTKSNSRAITARRRGEWRQRQAEAYPTKELGLTG